MTEEEEAMGVDDRVEWDGEGLPPVGCECEINPHGEWFRATVYGYGKNKFLAAISNFQRDSDGDVIGGEHAYWIESTKFRPIRTKAERDREELESTLLRWKDSTVEVIAGILIDNGWKKGDRND